MGCAVWTLVLVMTAAASELPAVDSKGRYFAYGAGQKTFEDYVKFREKRLETHERYTKGGLYEIVNKIAGIGAAVGLIGGALIGDQMQARQQQEDDLQRRMAAQDAEIQRQNLELQRLKAQQAR